MAIILTKQNFGNGIMAQDELVQLSQNMWLCKEGTFFHMSCTELIAILFTAIKICIVLLTCVFWSTAFLWSSKNSYNNIALHFSSWERWVSSLTRVKFPLHRDLTDAWNNLYLMKLLFKSEWDREHSGCLGVLAIKSTWWRQGKVTDWMA